jgi:hypothetical protein
MKKAVIVVCVFLLMPIAVSARSGCCSHHSGVCGCGCCDGTSLSATCAPYYPQCNKPPQIKTITPETTTAPASQTPTKISTTSSISESKSVALPTTQTPKETSKSDSGNGWLWFFGGLGVWGVVALINRKKK